MNDIEIMFAHPLILWAVITALATVFGFGWLTWACFSECWSPKDS